MRSRRRKGTFCLTTGKRGQKNAHLPLARSIWNGFPHNFLSDHKLASIAIRLNTCWCIALPQPAHMSRVMSKTNKANTHLKSDFFHQNFGAWQTVNFGLRGKLVVGNDRHCIGLTRMTLKRRIGLKKARTSCVWVVES